jgi:hypothetical protein
MPVSGRKPKPEGQKLNPNPLSHDWIQVLDVPYHGRRPKLPPKTAQATRDWWENVTTLPHCVVWHRGDWQFALDTARIHAKFVGGDTSRAPELRLRERAMGTTSDALRDLRIRYVQPYVQPQAEPASEPDSAPPSDLTDLDAERRKRFG